MYSHWTVHLSRAKILSYLPHYTYTKHFAESVLQSCQQCLSVQYMPDTDLVSQQLSDEWLNEMTVQHRTPRWKP